MLAWLLPSLLIAAPADVAVPKTVSVSMFKNGYAFLTREIAVKGSVTQVVEIPQASLGSLWFWTSGGSIDSITSVDEPGTKTVDTPAASFRDLLTLNIGKGVFIELRNPDAHLSPYAGTIKSVSAELVTLQFDNGSTVSLPISSVHTVREQEPGSGFVYTSSVKQPTNRRFYEIRVSGPVQKVTMLSLERGATWSPAYAVDITDPKKLTLVAKATTMNDIADLVDVRARLITGFPNVPFRDFIEPLTSGMSIDQWAGTVSPSPGGFGGASRRSEAMSQNAYAPSAVADMPDWSGVPVGSGVGEALGDLFFYDLPKFSLKKGARKFEILFRTEAEYEHVYCWDVADNTVNNVEYREVPVNSPPEEVWHALRFKNTANQPLTTAPATIIEKGEMVGQAMTSYVPRGAEAELRVNKSLDVPAEQAEEELSRERGAVKNSSGYPIFDLVTLKGTLVVKNMRPEAIKVCIKKVLTGEIIATDHNPKITKTAKGLRQMNPVARLDWTETVEKGKKLELTYQYKLYVRSQN